MSRFQNIMFQEAFGNYENLLLKVTYNPAMGNYLDMVNNDRPNGTRVPNENYAREILQLFSVGLYELNADGTPILDAQNQPVPTYDQADIVEFARVFTGYTYASAANPAGPATGKQGRYYGANMVPYPAHRDHGPRPERQDAAERHGAAGRPDGQAGHRRRGAQRVHAPEHRPVRREAADPAARDRQSVATPTSPASPPCSTTTAATSAATSLRSCRAILLDPEARGGPKTASDFGQLREPVLMVTGLLRALERHHRRQPPRGR